MPYLTPDQQAERKAKKAEQARRLFQRQQELRDEADMERRTMLAFMTLRGPEDVAALLRISPRAAADVVKRPGFPKPLSPAGDRIKLWLTSDVLAWLQKQEAAE